MLGQVPRRKDFEVPIGVEPDQMKKANNVRPGGGIDVAGQ
jgi:hypothetical protein